ncbi:hypothetical protein [Plantactinospora soyae]|uniref:Uncharacterized protein n=1 Tax=Plantactinospora soyae TaxID=1544732 RepID=A0A927MGU2_9ACTN|nr:hypothetical protein [Plantactinospora soyae]MBE1491438.1 hypothetical protein [Plantactinospora soyae]
MEQAPTPGEHRCDADARPAASRRPNRPYWGWRALTLGVLGVAAVHLGTTIVSIVVMVQDYWLVRDYQVGRRAVDIFEILARLERLEQVNDLVWFVLLAHIGTYLAWFVVSQKTVERHGGDPKPTLAHWTFAAWRISVVGIFVLAIIMSPGGGTDRSDAERAISDAMEFERLTIFVAALRLPIVGLLVAGVCVVIWRMYQLAASSPPPPATAQYLTQPAGPITLPRTAVQEGAGKDAFWHEVAQVVARSSGPLPLLEAWAAAPSARRWHLIDGEPGVAATRTRLSPWSGITVYGQPPLVPDEAVLGRLADEARRLREDRVAGGAIGLIESEDGKFRFEQLTSDGVLQSWLDQARSASRAGVYPVLAAADPAALTSV